MTEAQSIVDILLEGEADDMDAFVQGSGVLTPGTQVAERWQAALKQKEGELADPEFYRNRGGKDWFYTEGLRYGDGYYEVHTNYPKGKAQCNVTVTLPKHVQQSFNIYDQMQTVEFRRKIMVPMDAESVRRGIDRLYAWTQKEMQKWNDLAYCRRIFKKLAPDTGKQVGSEFRSVFKDHRGMAGFEHNGYAKSTVPNAVAAKMAAWMRARVAQLGIRESEDMGEIDMEKFVRDAGVTVEPDDFVMDSHQIGFPGGMTGNYRYYISYRRLLHKGRPVFLGTITGCHDYNRTGHAGLVHYYVDVPRRTWKYDPRDRQGRRIYKDPKFRSNYGHGAVHMNPPPQGGTSVKSLFDGCKLLLSLLKIQHPLKQAESIEEAAADAGLLDELGSLATDPILIPSKVKVDFLTMDDKAGDFYFTVSLLRSRHSYRHFLGTLKRSHTGQWFIEDMPDVILRKRVEPYPDPNEAFPTDLAAERALIKHIIRQFPGLLTPRW